MVHSRAGPFPSAPDELSDRAATQANNPIGCEDRRADYSQREFSQIEAVAVCAYRTGRQTERSASEDAESPQWVVAHWPVEECPVPSRHAFMIASGLFVLQRPTRERPRMQTMHYSRSCRDACGSWGASIRRGCIAHNVPRRTLPPPPRQRRHGCQTVALLAPAKVAKDVQPARNLTVQRWAQLATPSAPGGFGPRWLRWLGDLETPDHR
jgi:hypothetical protein